MTTHSQIVVFCTDNFIRVYDVRTNGLIDMEGVGKYEDLLFVKMTFDFKRLIFRAGELVYFWSLPSF